MKAVTVILVAMASVAVAKPDELYYDPKYDTFNVDEIVDSLRLLKGYMHCFIGDGNCTPDGKNFKKWIPDGVQNSCEKCTPKQKVMVAKVIRAAMEKLPKEYEAMLDIHDPERKRMDRLNAFLEQYAH